MPKYSAKINKRGSGNYIPVVIETDSRGNAEELIKAQYPGHDIYFLEEIKSGSNQVGSSTEAANQRSNSGGENSESGCLGIILGIVCIAGYLAYRAMFPSDVQTSSPPPTEQAASTASRDSGSPEAPGESDSAGANDAGSFQADVATQSSPKSFTESPAIEEAGDGFPFAARIVDRRERVVLQSGPGITSRNVAKLETGIIVHAEGTDGKWIRVKTEDGLVGFVRRKQLEFTPPR